AKCLACSSTRDTATWGGPCHVQRPKSLPSACRPPSPCREAQASQPCPSAAACRRRPCRGPEPDQEGTGATLSRLARPGSTTSRAPGPWPRGNPGWKAPDACGSGRGRQVVVLPSDLQPAPAQIPQQM